MRIRAEKEHRWLFLRAIRVLQSDVAAAVELGAPFCPTAESSPSRLKVIPVALWLVSRQSRIGTSWRSRGNSPVRWSETVSHHFGVRELWNR